jgi:1-acyl-sn-glycerol-3-phosphate acyltransferase
MIDQQQQKHLLFNQHCHQWIPPLGNVLLNNKKENNKTIKTFNENNKEKTSLLTSPKIVAEFIPPVSVRENDEENSKRKEEEIEEIKRKTMEENKGKN